MAVTAALLTSCRTQIQASAAYAAYNTAHAAYAEATRSARPPLWHAAYGDGQAGLSPAYRLKAAIREAVVALADETVTPPERESAYQTLVAQYVASPPPPRTAIEEQAELQKLLIEDAAS